MYKVFEQSNLFLSQNETSLKRKRPKHFIVLCDFLYKVWFVQYDFSKFAFADS